MIEKSRLQIPRPYARPGEEPDFSFLELSPAGAVDKPPIGSRTRDIEFLSSGLVRVLDDDHEAQGPWDPNLDPEKLQVGLRWMLLNRAFDNRMWQIQRQGRISFYMQALGEEAISIAQGMALRAGDMCFPSYRNQGLYMYRGVKLVDLMCQCLSNTRDMCKGRQLPVMYHSKEGHVFSISGNLATQYPHAVGWAMASAINASENKITTAEAYETGWKSGWDFSDRDYIFGRLNWRKDRFGGFDTQFSQTVGYGRRLIDTDKHKLNAEIGAGARQSEAQDGTKENETIGTGGLYYTWILSETAEFRQDLKVEAGSENTYFESVTALKARLVGDLALVASYTVKHNTDVPALTEKTDTYTALSLEYAF